MGRSPTGGFRGGLARGGQKRGRQADFQAAIVQEIEALLGRPAVQGLDFEALETAARQRTLQVAARALEGWSNADTSDHTGAHLACACGAPALHRGRHGKKLRKCSRHPARGASLLLPPDVSERRPEWRRFPWPPNWRRAVKLPSVPASRGRACTGAYSQPTPASHSAAASSVVDSKTFGSVEPRRGLLIVQKFDVHPIRWASVWIAEWRFAGLLPVRFGSRKRRQTSPAPELEPFTAFVAPHPLQLHPRHLTRVTVRVLNRRA